MTVSRVLKISKNHHHPDSVRMDTRVTRSSDQLPEYSFPLEWFSVVCCVRGHSPLATTPSRLSQSRCWYLFIFCRWSNSPACCLFGWFCSVGTSPPLFQTGSQDAVVVGQYLCREVQGFAIIQPSQWVVADFVSYYSENLAEIFISFFFFVWFVTGPCAGSALGREWLRGEINIPDWEVAMAPWLDQRHLAIELRHLAWQRWCVAETF